MSGEPDASHRSLLYPIGLKLAGRRCVVVGSGPIARRKIQDLMDCGALVRAIDPGGNGHGAVVEPDNHSLSRRAFVSSDLDDACLVVVSSTNRRLQEEVAEAAEERGIPCNVVDVNDLCSFYAPAVLRIGSLTISVATDGKFPLLAVAIRDRIAASLGDAVGPALDLLGEARTLATDHFPDDPEGRVAALRRLLSEPALNAIVDGRLSEFEEHWTSWKNELSQPV